ncbi:predicted protein [Micromonas commoda]|uniref:Uncharacterized protein n=1 Tax=Micromonas commoda (strain RCC299 / NOUM17 / CCMP2709) TaxID=296587 RepID=C1EJ60_MICCC|nr:predicted protein [Micromonas commoda]ACO67981.1 predicted protein [Micromonas commoda]|eukprot:XP_002506723.1 predicted protein [Micromonas commoda]
MRLLPSGATTILKNWGPRSEKSADVNAAAACAWVVAGSTELRSARSVSSDPDGDDASRADPSPASDRPFSPLTATGDSSVDMASNPAPASNVWNTDWAPGVTRPTCACAAPTVNDPSIPPAAGDAAPTLTESLAYAALDSDRRAAAPRVAFSADPGERTSTIVRTVSPVTRPAMSCMASLLLARVAAAKKSSKTELASCVLSRYVPTAAETKTEHRSSSTLLPSGDAAIRSILSSTSFTVDDSPPLLAGASAPPPPAPYCSLKASMTASSACRVAPDTMTEASPQFRGSSTLSSTASSELVAGPSPPSSSPPSRRPPSTPPPLVAAATPLATPEVTLAAHSSSSGVLSTLSACLSDGGTGASASECRKSLTSTASLATVSPAAIAAVV